MSLYLYCLSGEYKNALLNGTKVPVYAYRFIGKDTFSRPSRIKRRQENAGERFRLLKPQYAAVVHEQEWEGAMVYRGPTSGNFCENMPAAGKVGFLHQNGRQWEILPQTVINSDILFGGREIPRREILTITNGNLSGIAQYRIDGEWISDTEFQEWKGSQLAKSS